MRFCIRFISILTALIILGTITVSASESFITLYGFTFDVNNNGEAVIHAYDDRSSDVAIPEKLINAYVAEIDDYAFFNDTKITSVSFDNASGLRRIGTDAFYGCTNLKTLSIPSWVTTLGFGVFQACTGLESVQIGSGVTDIPAQCFCGCNALDDVVVPTGAGSIGNMSFGSCDTLSDITIPDTVTQIADNAFKNSDNVTIFCSENSYAHSYAIANNISYKFVERLHKGDANLDYNLNITDATTIQKFKAGLKTLSKRSQKLGDVNNDGTLSVRDATLIQMRIADIIDSF
jgi:hypothetical protein